MLSCHDPTAHPHKLYILDLSPERVLQPDGSFQYCKVLGRFLSSRTKELRLSMTGKHAVLEITLIRWPELFPIGDQFQTCH